MSDLTPKTPEDIIALATEGMPEPPPNVKAELWREAMAWAKTVVFAVLFALAINNFVIVNALVPTGSMEGTIRGNDRVVAFRLSYLFGEPQRYDIIVFRGPDDGTLYVKRIIGMPGETISVVGGQVYVNGASAHIRSDFVQVGPHGYMGPGFMPQVIPQGHFFVLGDNRGNSIDSRHWVNPFVAEGRILGRVVFRYFPGFENLGRSAHND